MRTTQLCFKIPSWLTRWLLHGSLPRRSSVQTGNQQTHAAPLLLQRWSNPTRSCCCGNSAPAPSQSSAWNPAITQTQCFLLLFFLTETADSVSLCAVNICWKTKRRICCTSSGFSLVMRAAMTWPRGQGVFDKLSKSMGQSPQGWTP